MKLVHYPDIKKGKEAHVEFDDSQLDDGVGKHCLIGHFLDGKMPLPLLSATARAVWKEHGKFTVKQLGSCYLFEFEDEASKMLVLEGGPYFFSHRYLVLKEWKRMLVPSKNHPSSIPVWIKLHRLPLEFSTHIGFSKIGSAIGKPIHVDEATANKRRLDFGRICVEIEEGDELPSDITVSVNDEHVMVGVKYQWLPPRCESCKVFGHSCSPKTVPKTTSTTKEWQVVGKGKLSSNTTLRSDIKELDSAPSHPSLSEEQVTKSSVPLPNSLQTTVQQGTELPLDPSCSLGTASSSHSLGSIDNKPPPSTFLHILLSQESHPNPNPYPTDPTLTALPSDDTLSEIMDKEILVEDREGALPSSTQEKAEGDQSAQASKRTTSSSGVEAKNVHSIQGSKGSPNPSSGGQKFAESNSSKKKGG